jgi:Family of unknown function (DUF6356)
MGMSWPRSAFVEHPQSVGETYREHFVVATGFGLRLIAAGLACLVHACVPAWFTRSGSRTVQGLARELAARANAARYAVAAADSASDCASLQSLSRS